MSVLHIAILVAILGVLCTAAFELTHAEFLRVSHGQKTIHREQCSDLDG